MLVMIVEDGQSVVREFIGREEAFSIDCKDDKEFDDDTQAVTCTLTPVLLESLPLIAYSCPCID